jgi:phage terminase large subunit-like protein
MSTGVVTAASKPTWCTSWRDSATTDGDAVVDFARTFLHVDKGVRAGQPLELVEWQADLLRALYSRDVKGRRRYRRAVVGLGRKNGKSLIGSVIALHGLIEGGSGAEVYAAAGDRQQARVVFDEARRQVQQSPALNGICKIYRDAIAVPATGSVFRVLSSDAKLQQGLNPSTVVFDELHVQKDDELWDALTLGSGARVDPLIVAITTAGYDLDSLCGRLYQFGKRVSAGEEEGRYFGFWWWQATDDCDAGDREQWRAANPNIEIGLLDEEDMELAHKQTSDSAFRRYRLNQFVRAQESWLPAGVFETSARPDLPLRDDLPVYVGIDMALKHDSVAVVCAQQQDGLVVTRAKIWYPQESGLDVAEVEFYLRELHAQFDVREFAYDPAYFQRSAEQLIDDGLPMVEYPQNRTRMIPACGNAYELIVNKRVVHDGSPTFVDQVLSAAQRMTDEGWRLSKGKSKRKIDAAIALVIALDRATMVSRQNITPDVIDVWKEED